MFANSISNRLRIRPRFVVIALSLAIVGTGAVQPETADASVRRTTQYGYAQTSVSITAGLRISTMIQADSNAPQWVSVRAIVYDNIARQWVSFGYQSCTLNTGALGSGFNCSLGWTVYPRAGWYYITMEYSWFTTAGWQTIPEDLDWVYYYG